MRCNWCEVERLKLVHRKKKLEIVKKKHLYNVMVDGKCVMFFSRWKDSCFCGE